MINREPKTQQQTTQSLQELAQNKPAATGFVNKPNVLLVDDDLTYCKIMKRAADISSTPLTYCISVDEFGDLQTWNFDVAIIDYDLGAITGFELTRYLESKTQRITPVILISGTHRNISNVSPATICQFIHKSQSPFYILEAAASVHALALAERNRKKPGG
jgi:DNA-binding response OmpR family regulator